MARRRTRLPSAEPTWPLPPSATRSDVDLQRRRNPPGQVRQAVVQERHAGLQAVRHADAVFGHQEAVQEGLHLEVQRPLEQVVGHAQFRLQAGAGGHHAAETRSRAGAVSPQLGHEQLRQLRRRQQAMPVVESISGRTPRAVAAVSPCRYRQGYPPNSSSPPAPARHTFTKRLASLATYQF